MAQQGGATRIPRNIPTAPPCYPAHAHAHAHGVYDKRTITNPSHPPISQPQLGKDVPGDWTVVNHADADPSTGYTSLYFDLTVGLGRWKRKIVEVDVWNYGKSEESWHGLARKDHGDGGTEMRKGKGGVDGEGKN